MNYIQSWSFVNAVESVVRRMGGTGPYVPLTTFNQYTVANNAAVADVSGVAHQALAVANATALKIPIDGYASASNSVDISGDWTEMVAVTLTTDISNTPIMIWGNLYVRDDNNGSTIETRIHINTTVSQYSPSIAIDIANKKVGTFPIIFRGAGPSPAGPVLIQIDARVTHGTASRLSAQIMVLANPRNA